MIIKYSSISWNSPIYWLQIYPLWIYWNFINNISDISLLLDEQVFTWDFKNSSYVEWLKYNKILVDLIEDNKTIHDEQFNENVYKYNYELFRMYFSRPEWSF